MRSGGALDRSPRVMRAIFEGDAGHRSAAIVLKPRTGWRIKALVDSSSLLAGSSWPLMARQPSYDTTASLVDMPRPCVSLQLQ